MAAIIVLVLLGLINAYVTHRNQRKVRLKVEGIDKAVNSRPSDQPKLYDLVQTLDTKVDTAIKELRERSSQHDRRDDDRFDQVLDAVGRLDERVENNRNDFVREIRRLDQRITDRVLLPHEAPQQIVLEDGDTPYK